MKEVCKKDLIKEQKKLDSKHPKIDTDVALTDKCKQNLKALSKFLKKKNKQFKKKRSKCTSHENIKSDRTSNKKKSA